MRYSSVGLIGKPNHKDTVSSIETLAAHIKLSGRKVLIVEDLAPEISGAIRTSIEQIGREAELAIVVGGDGSMLGAARILAKHDVHVVGVNRGKLGYLADINPDDIAEQLNDLFEEKPRVEERFLLDVSVHRDGQKLDSGTALNEVVLHHGKVAHMMEFEIFINDQFVSSQRADGMIVATPTGSTAYSLSGGGPIITPTLNAVTLVTMFPHTLASRPIVVDADCTIRMRVAKERSESIQVSCDSHITLPVEANDDVIIKKCAHTLNMVHSNQYDYFEVLRKKLKWGSSPY